jgi:hypothetical protein
MIKLRIIQKLLFVILLFGSILTLFIFFDDKKILFEENKIIKNEDIYKQNSIKKINEDQSNMIESIKYTFNNLSGDSYEITADYSEIDINNPDLMFLTNVKGTIFLKDNNLITLISDYANLNTKNFETTFIDNVLIERDYETIQSEKLYLVFDTSTNSETNEKNLIKMTNNVIYTRPGNTIKGDIFEMNLETKDSKVYMLNSKDKVIINSSIKKK